VPFGNEIRFFGPAHFRVGAAFVRMDMRRSISSTTVIGGILNAGNTGIRDCQRVAAYPTCGPWASFFPQECRHLALAGWVCAIARQTTCEARWVDQAARMTLQRPREVIPGQRSAKSASTRNSRGTATPSGAERVSSSTSPSPPSRADTRTVECQWLTIIDGRSFPRHRKLPDRRVHAPAHSGRCRREWHPQSPDRGFP
jgi:hypothetical protein